MAENLPLQFAIAFLQIFAVLLASALLHRWKRNPISLALFYVSGVLLVMTAITAGYIAAFLLHLTVSFPLWMEIFGNTAYFATWTIIPLLWVGHLGWVLSHHAFDTTHAKGENIRPAST